MKVRALIPRPVRRWLRRIADRVPFQISLRRPRPQFPGEQHRFEYQRRHVAFDIRPGARVLDIGSGGDPFPHATVLVDRFVELTPHRHGSLVRDGRPLLCADVHHLPFPDKTFDFVYSVHILEHVDDPLRACAEIMRIGRCGYLETPTFGEDMLFAWARGRHRWHVVGIGATLCFFEYSPRQLEGIRSTVWEDLIAAKHEHLLQHAYFENREVFEVMFTWVERFAVYVFHQDGRVESLNAPESR